MSERRGVQRALSNLFERKHGREPTDGVPILLAAEAE